MPVPDQRKDDDLRVSQDYAFAVIGDIKWENVSEAKKLLEEIIRTSTKSGTDVPQKVCDVKEKVIEYKQFTHSEDHKEYFFYTNTRPEPLCIVEVDKDKVTWCVLPDE